MADHLPLERPRESADRLVSVTLQDLAGRLSEIQGAASLTMAFRLVLAAQSCDEPVAWLTPTTSSFFAPDVEEEGVDLAALVVVRAPDPKAVARAADPLLRSGAFGLVVLDVGTVRPAQPLLARLLGLAQKHDAAVVFLTETPPGTPSLGSLVSWRAVVSRRRRADGEFACEVHVVKDKRRGPGFSFNEVCRGPAGVR